MILRIGSTGDNVKMLQEYLGLTPDGVFGVKTDRYVRLWQENNNLKVDGIVGPKTWDAMGLASTDISEGNLGYKSLGVVEYFLPNDEYKIGPTNKEYLFLHHTAGWHNPYNVINHWSNDDRGAIATEFVIGGQSIKDSGDQYDGLIVRAIPDGGYGWHLGKNGSQYMHTHSIGIEVCNFGYIVDNKTYAGTNASKCQITRLSKPFRGFDMWHKYSDDQLQSLSKLIKFIGDRDNIQVRDGLIAEIKKHGAKGFNFNENAYYGRVKGMWTHTNTRKDKYDMYPCPRLMDMLLNI